MSIPLKDYAMHYPTIITLETRALRISKTELLKALEAFTQEDLVLIIKVSPGDISLIFSEAMIGKER